MSALLHRETFRAMGTVCTVAATARTADERRARRALAAARAEIEACEKVLSRFDPASDVSSTNRRAGEWVDVDARLVEALEVAIDGRHATAGRFDPTILPALVAAGYDRSFEALEERAPQASLGWRAGAEIDTDARAQRVRVESGAAVDLGAVGKGYSAERALLAMREEWDWLPGALVDLGGDVAAWGCSARRRRLADRGGRPPAQRVHTLRPRARARRGCDLGSERSAVRPRTFAPPPDRPGDRSACPWRPARGDGRRPRCRQSRDPRHGSRDLEPVRGPSRAG